MSVKQKRQLNKAKPAGRVDRTGWPSGEWDKEPDDISLTIDGFPCKIMRTNMGNLNGYVGIPSSNALSLCTKAELDSWIECHGDVTWVADSFPDATGKGLRVVGFDCGHYGDNMPGLSAIAHTPYGRGLVYRNVAYVTKELKAMVKQIKNVDIPQEHKFRVMAIHAANGG